jgi:1,4-alpha-glucan branching enzyme
MCDPTLRRTDSTGNDGEVNPMLAKRFFKTKDEVEVTFEVDRPDLGAVDLVADAFEWKPLPLKRADRGKGPFRLKVRLPKNGAVQFRYIFDHHLWENDEAADAYWPNDRGSDNSVVLTGADVA